MESSYPRGNAGSSSSNNNSGSSRRSGSSNRHTPSSSSSRRSAATATSGSADRPLAAEDEYIRSLRKRQVEREQQQQQQAAASSSSRTSGSSNHPYSTSSAGLYSQQQEDARRSSSSNYYTSSGSSSRRGPTPGYPFGSSSSSSRRAVIPRREESDASTEPPTTVSTTSSSRRPGSSSHSNHHQYSSKSTRSSGSPRTGNSSKMATTAGASGSFRGPSSSDVLVSGISSSSNPSSQHSSTTNSSPNLPVGAAANTNSNTSRVVQVDGHLYSVSAGSSSSSHGKRRTKSPSRRSEQSLTVSSATREPANNSSHARSSNSMSNLPTPVNQDILMRSSQSRRSSHSASSSSGGNSNHRRLDANAAASSTLSSSDAAANVRALRAQRLRETAVQRRNSGSSSSAVMAAVAAMEEATLRNQQLQNSAGSLNASSSSLGDTNNGSRHGKPPLRQYTADAGTANPTSPVRAAAAALDRNVATAATASAKQMSPRPLPQTAPNIRAPAAPLVAPSPAAAPSSLPGVNQFLLQRRTTTGPSLAIPHRSVSATTAGAAAPIPSPASVIRSTTEPNSSNNYIMSSKLSRESKSFEFDSDTSEDAADDQETASCDADESSSDEDNDADSESPEYSVRVLIVSAVDLPANVVPNLPLSPVLRVGLVRIMPAQDNPQGDADDMDGPKQRQQEQTKALMSRIVSDGLNSVPKSKVRTTSAKILSKRDNGSVEFHEEMRWDRVRYPEEMVVAIELSSRAVMTPRNIKESPPPPKSQIPLMTASLGRNSMTGQRQVDSVTETSSRGNLAAFGSLFKRPVKKEIETATAAAAVAHMLVEPNEGESKLPTMRPLNQSELYVKLRPRKRKKRMKMTEDLHIASQVIPLTKLSFRKALLGSESARVEQWIELDGSYGSVAPPDTAAPLANKRNPSILVEITFSTSERLDDSEDDMDSDDAEAHIRASYAKRQSMKIRNQLKEETERREAKQQVKKEPELVPGLIDFVCVVGARDIGDQKYDDGSNGWVNSSPECCILERFPADDSFHANNGRQVTLPDKVEWFCFPESCRLWRGSTPPNLDELNLQRFSASSPANIATSIASFDACLGCTTSFTWFVLSSNSDEYGSECAKNYGAAIRFFVPAPKGIDPTQDDFAQAIIDPQVADEFDLPGGKRLWVPMAVLITSRLPIVGTMEVMLLRICEALGNGGIPGKCGGFSHYLHKELASLIISYQRPIPGVVHCSIPFLAGDRFHIALPPRGGLPPLPHGNSVASVCRLLGPDGLNFLLAAFLTECKIVIHSNDMANLCLVAEVMTALIYPFTWTLPYVPVLPSEMLELIEAPLSYLIGIPSCNLKFVDPRQLEDVIVVDLDKDFSSAEYAEMRDDGLKIKTSTPLPASVASNISKAVYRLLRTEEENEDDSAGSRQRSFPRLEAESATEREFRVAVAIEICGLLRGFQDCLVHASSSQPIFNVDRFLQIAPALFEEQRGTLAQGSQETTQVLSPRSRRFMSLLVNCQHFHQLLETLESDQALFFKEIMSTVHTNSATRHVARSGHRTLDYRNTQASLCAFLQRLEDKVPTYRVGRLFEGPADILDQSQSIGSGSRWPQDLLQRITTNDSMSATGSVDQSDGGIKQISVEYLVELEKNPWQYQHLFVIPPEHLTGPRFDSALRKVKLKEAIGERRYQAWKLALEQEKFDVDDSNAMIPETGANSSSTNLDLNSLLTSAADDMAPLSSNPWEDGFTKSKLVSAQQRLQEAKDRDILRRCIESALSNKGFEQSTMERDLVSESEIVLRNLSAREFLLSVLKKRTHNAMDGVNNKHRPMSSGSSKLENNAFSILLRLGCALLDACMETSDYNSAYAILKLTAGIYTILGEKDQVAVSYMTSRLGMHPIFADMGVWEKSKDLHVVARKENKAEEVATGADTDEYSDEDDEYDAAVATLYEMLGYGIPSEELARFATRVNEINGWHHSERGQSLLMLARRLSVRREHGTGGTSPEKKSDLEMINMAAPAVMRQTLKGETGNEHQYASQNQSSNPSPTAYKSDETFEWMDIGWCHPAAQSSRRANTGSTQDSRRPGGTSSLLSMLDETKINADAAKQTTKHMKRSAITTLSYLGSSVVITGGIDGGVFLARKTFPSAESLNVPDGVERNGVSGVHLDWGSSGSRYTVGSTSNTLDGEYGVGAVTCLATASGGTAYVSKTQPSTKSISDCDRCLDDEDLLSAMDGRRVVAGTSCGDLRVWNVKDVLSSVFYSNQNETSAVGSAVQRHASGAASSRVANSRKSATDFAAGSSLTRLKFSLRGRALSGHRGGVSCIDVPSSIYRPDSIVSGGADGLIKLWNLRSPSAAVTRMDQIAPSGGDGAAQRGKQSAAPSGDALSILSGHGSRIVCLKTAWHGDRLLSGGADRTVRLWDLAGSGGRCLQSMSGHLGWVTHVRYWGPNTIVSASTDRSIALWDARVRGTPLFMLRHHYAPISDLLVGSRTDPVMISAGSDGTVAAWDFRYLAHQGDSAEANPKSQNRLCTTVRDPDGRLFMRDYNRQGPVGGSVLLSRGPSRNGRKTILCVGTDNVIREWDFQSGDVVSEHVTGHCDLVSSFHALQGNKLYDSQLSTGALTGTISSSWDGTVRMRTLVDKSTGDDR